MSAIIRLVQGSPEWLSHRKHYRNASETPAVVGVSPWITPYQLWLQRTGRAEPHVNPAMLRGRELEPIAREAYERLTGLVMQPLVLVEGEYSASLDGMTLDGRLVLEIKCPMKGKDSDLWKQVESRQLPEHCHWQVQHQLLVAGAELAHVYVFDGSQGVLLEQRPQLERWPEIRSAWDQFIALVATDTPPPLTDRDTVERTDPAWREAAARFLVAKHAADEAAAELDAAKRALIALTTHPSERGFEVLVTRYWKAGGIDYKKIPQLCSVDLDSFRSRPREEIRVTVSR